MIKRKSLFECNTIKDASGRSHILLDEFWHISLFLHIMSSYSCIFVPTLSLRESHVVCRSVHRLLPWCSQTFAVAFSNSCRGVFKLLPWCSQNLAVMFTNFCRGVNKLLPWSFQTFTVAIKIFFRVYQIVFSSISK